MPLALTNAPISIAAFPDVAYPEPPRAPKGSPSRPPKPRLKNAQAVARRPGREQGMALEQLGHAVEYLIDSRMFLTGIAYTRAEEQALQILMTASRDIFETCPVIVPWRTAATTWLVARWSALLRYPSQLPR